MTGSDWIVVGTCLFLGSCALLAPYLSEVLKRRFISPKLRVEFENRTPYCHRTKWRVTDPNGLVVGEPPVYYFRFSVQNHGKARAQSCEAILEEVWKADSAGNYYHDDTFAPTSLKWEGNVQFIDINPGRRMFVDIGHISHPDHQSRHEKSSSVLIDPSDGRLRFILDLKSYYFFQIDSLFPGKHRLKVGIVGENFPRLDKWFELTWSGNWKVEEKDMLREAVFTVR